MATKTCLVIGATGAQGIPVVRALTSDGAYKVKAMTSSRDSDNAKLLSALSNVELVVGSSTDETDLQRAFEGVDLAFVNTNGFALGEMKEIYWGIRIFEIAARAGVKHYIWGGLDYVSRKSGYDPAVKVGHHDGKAKVGDWMRSQPTTPMNWSILTSSPYMEMLSEFLRPKRAEDGTYVFSAPLGDGAVPFIHLDDLGLYARWLFDHPEEARGFELEIATEHVHFADLAKTFTEVTGKPSIYKRVSLEEYFASRPWGPAVDPSVKIGARASQGNDTKTMLSYQENFGAWWTMWSRSGGNKGLIRRDYEMLDRILPGRVKTVGEWMKKTGYTGEMKPVLKDWSDRQPKN